MSRSSFAGIEIGKSALVVSQIGLDVTGHNIANVDTAGYSRQRIESTAYDPFWTLGRAMPVEAAKVGGGVAIKVLDQIRSAYLDSRYRTENTINAYWQKRVQGLTYVQSYFDYTIGPTSINDAIASFFGAIETLSKDTVESAQRTLLKDEGLYLAQQFNTIYAGLIDLQNTYNEVVKVTVEKINNIADQIVELNKSIYGFEVTGLIANDLRDKRNLLVDQLSALIPVEYYEEPYPVGTDNSKFVVKIGDEILVEHDKSYKLSTEERPNTIEGEDPVLIPVWADPRPIPDVGAPYTFYLGYSKSNTVKLTSSFPVTGDSTGEQAVKDHIIKINELVKEFNTLEVYYSGNPSNPFEGPGGGDTPAVIRAREILTELQGYFADDVVGVDCDLGGNHAYITVAGATETLIFARSALCIESGRATAKIGYITPTVGEYLDPLKVTGGELLAYMEIRDSDDPKVQGIPYYVEMLNNLARAIVQEINKQHREGWTDPLNAESETGINFFDESLAMWAWRDNHGNVYHLNEFNDWENVADASDIVDPTVVYTFTSFADDSTHGADFWTDNIGNVYLLNLDGEWENISDPTDIVDPTITYESFYDMSGVTAKNVRLSDEVIESAFNIACSSVKVVRDGLSNELQSGNNENMLVMYDLFLKKDIYVDAGAKSIDIGSLDGYATRVRFEVGTTLNNARNTSENSDTLLNSVTNQRLSIMGVSLDEEMTNLIKYQYAFQGASRVITAMDEALDVLINRTGRVGL